MNPADPTEPLGELADQCVKCGLCLPGCPTYQLSGNESESPRGRVELTRAIGLGKLPAGSRASRHIMSCIGCGACERNCPSDVQVLRILDLGRTRLRRTTSARNRMEYGLTRILGDSRSSAFALAVLFGLQRLRVLGWLRRLPGLATLLPPDTTVQHLRHLAGATPARGTHSGTPPEFRPGEASVILYGGCVIKQLDKRALLAAQTLLKTLDIPYRQPPAAACCGALATHQGFADTGRRQRLAWSEQFLSAPGDSVILTFSAACEREIRAHHPDARVMAVERYLLEHTDLRQRLRTNAHPRHLLLHAPCSLTAREDQEKRLETLPGVRLTRLKLALGCCGSGGIQQLLQPDYQLAFLRSNAEEIASKREKDSILLSANGSCRLQLARSIDLLDRPLEVLHPVEMLARMLPASAQP
jgi:glycolate oxidase iron-sulfur subunit